jgi:hypothetical protein
MRLTSITSPPPWQLSSCETNQLHRWILIFFNATYIMEYFPVLQYWKTNGLNTEAQQILLTPFSFFRKDAKFNVKHFAISAKIIMPTIHGKSKFFPARIAIWREPVGTIGLIWTSECPPSPSIHRCSISSKMWHRRQSYCQLHASRDPNCVTVTLFMCEITHSSVFRQDWTDFLLTWASHSINSNSKGKLRSIKRHWDRLRYSIVIHFLS